MKKIYFKSIYILSLILFSCGGSGGDDGGGGGGPVDPPPTPQKPQKAVLSKPANNSECLEVDAVKFEWNTAANTCLLYTSPSPRDRTRSRMPSSA